MRKGRGVSDNVEPEVSDCGPIENIFPKAIPGINPYRFDVLNILSHYEMSKIFRTHKGVKSKIEGRYIYTPVYIKSVKYLQNDETKRESEVFFLTVRDCERQVMRSLIGTPKLDKLIQDYALISTANKSYSHLIRIETNLGKKVYEYGLLYAKFVFKS